MSIKTVRRHALERKRKKIAMKRAQDLIPLTKRIKGDIFLSDDLYTRTWAFSNMNFKLLGQEMEAKVLRKWCEALNGLEPGATYKYTIVKQRFNEESYKKERFLKYKEDGMDHFRGEVNRMLSEKIKDTKLIDEKRFFQATVKRRKDDEAVSFFNRSEPEFDKFFRNVGSDLVPLAYDDYLKVIWDFLHMDSGDYFEKLDLSDIRRGKGSLKNLLAPYQFESDNFGNYIKIGSKYFRSLYVPPNSYAKYIKDSVLSELTSLDKNMCVSVDIIPVPSDEAYALIDNLEFRSETNISKYTERQAQHGNFNASIPYNMRKKAEQIEEYNRDLNERDQRLLLGHITILHCADSLEELNEDTDSLKTTARQQGCELMELTLQQEDGIITALPFGVNRFIGKYGERLRTLTTEALASFIPFTVQELSHKNGIYYGQNRLTRSPIFINRKEGMNGNCVICGSSGAGKSFKKKEEMEHVILNTDDKIIIIDPEREYSYLVKQMGGEVIKMSADSPDHINAFAISESYNDGLNPVTLKSEFVLTLYAMAKDPEQVTPAEKSLLDRCTRNVLDEYVRSGYQGTPPTLLDLHKELLEQGEELATSIALTLELYTTGSLNLFSKQTNVDMSKRVISFDISDLGDVLMPIAMLVITDFISNTLSQNRKEGVYTWVDIDELYLMFLQEYTAIYFYKLWKRIRKYGGLCTGITQQLEDLLKSPTAKTMLANSDFIIMLSASETDSILIQDALKIDDTLMGYITEVGSKNGLIKIGKSYVPFTDEFPSDTALYKIMSTKFKEEV